MHKTELIIFLILSTAVVIVFITGIMLFIFKYRSRKLLYNKEKEMIAEQHTQELLNTQLEMQTQTMQHIGREIHDNVGQKLTLASLYTQQLAYENKAPQVNDAIENIGNIINESLAELRQLSKSLTDDSISCNSISALLQQECDKVNGLKKSTVHFSCNNDSIRLPYQPKSILLRIIQEFLQNSIKHADCKNITVLLEAGDRLLTLSMKDDGVGFAADEINSNGIGLSNMKKRTTLLGGSFLLQSNQGQGTRLQITIPLKNAQP